MKRIKNILISILISEGVGLLSGLFTFGMVKTGYQQTIKPSFAPPSWVFGVVWPILYALMGIAAYLVWRKGTHKPRVKKALTFYGIQLFFNFLWPILYFGLNLRGIAFIEILILLVLIIITTIKFYKIDKVAGYLMIPYIIWVTFASVLNYSIWMLNI